MDQTCSFAPGIGASLADSDPEVSAAVCGEIARQNDKVLLIASENYASRAVMEAQGSVFTNKYAEGYPNKRYYGGCEFVDSVECLAIERAKELFGAEHANVQPHSGSGANMAAYFAFMKPGDTFLAMELAHGGHLTHGSPVNFSGVIYNPASYGVDPETETLNYDTIRKRAIECNPKIIVAGASAYPRVIDFVALRKIADEVGALLMTDMAHIAGLVAAGEHPSPVPHCHIVTSTTHKTLRGPRSGMILCKQELAAKIDRAVFPGLQGGPLEHVVAAKAVCFKEAMEPSFKEYQKQVRLNAVVLAEELVKGGLRLVSGGTDNHLMLVDLIPIGVTGKVAQEVLDDTGIVLNKSMIPFDKQKPTITSGIRIGTPAATTRGMKEPEMRTIAELILRCLKNVGDSPENIRERLAVAAEVKLLTKRFPVYDASLNV